MRDQLAACSVGAAGTWGLVWARVAASCRAKSRSDRRESRATMGSSVPAERKVLEAGAGVRMELLAWGDTVMEPHLFRIAPEAGSGDPYTHEGEEFIYVLRGDLEIAVDGEEYRLKPGDSFYFESRNEHHWKNPGKKETLVLWVNTPPTF